MQAAASPSFDGTGKPTPEALEDIAKAVRSLGYNCRQAVDVEGKGQDSRGVVIKVTCIGAHSGSERFQFRVTASPNNQVYVSPWRD